MFEKRSDADEIFILFSKSAWEVKIFKYSIGSFRNNNKNI